MTDRRIEYLPVSDLKEWEGNPKKHDIPMLKASITEFGFVSPMVLDEGTGFVVAGNGRLEAMRELQEAGGAPPVGVRVLGTGQWAVPVVRGVTFKDITHAQAYLVGDNRLNELGGWETTELLTILESLENTNLLEVAGYDQDSVEDLLASIGNNVIELPPFEGSYVETEQELQERIESRTYDGVNKEVVILVTESEHAAFVEMTGRLKEEWQLTSNKEVVLESLHRSVGLLV